MAGVRLPSLNSLRAFEAAARRLSFKDAAAELNVTPAAIGHQVKSLESFFGVPLFIRSNRSLILTRAGLECLPDLREGFVRLTKVAEKLESYQDDQHLSVTAAPSFAAKWLIPRLQGFQKLHPNLTVHIDTDVNELDLERSAIDLGIRFGSGRYSKLNVDRLMGETLFPVCSPEWLARTNSINSPEDLSKITLLHVEGETGDTTWPDWIEWLHAADCSSIDAKSGPRFTQSIMAVQSAIDGNGVALAPYSIVANDLSANRLVRLFRSIPGIPTSYAYYLVSPGKFTRSPALAAFCEWLKVQASEFETIDGEAEL